jgi:hypothetical protein
MSRTPMPPAKPPTSRAEIVHGPIASARFHTDLFIGGKQITPNGPAETSQGWTMVEDGDYLWLRYRDGAWGKTHQSNVRFVLYEVAKP